MDPDDFDAGLLFPSMVPIVLVYRLPRAVSSSSRRWSVEKMTNLMLASLASIPRNFDMYNGLHFDDLVLMLALMTMEQTQQRDVRERSALVLCCLLAEKLCSCPRRPSDPEWTYRFLKQAFVSPKMASMAYSIEQLGRSMPEKRKSSVEAARAHVALCRSAHLAHSKHSVVVTCPALTQISMEHSMEQV
jgi:hypothetical protein